MEQEREISKNIDRIHNLSESKYSHKFHRRIGYLDPMDIALEKSILHKKGNKDPSVFHHRGQGGVEGRVMKIFNTHDYDNPLVNLGSKKEWSLEDKY